MNTSFSSSAKIDVPEDLCKVNEIFSSHGHKAYLVGGAVRDTLLGKSMHDWDLATDATPQQVMQMFKRVIPTGIAHGTVTIHIFGHEIETTTFRTEAGYSDGRHPDSVTYASTIEEDLSRRDFTMNAIAADLSSGILIDPFGGQKDIADKVIRTVGKPRERFDEDGLRPVRAIRFAGQLGFAIDEQTFGSLSDKDVLQKVSGISIERFRDEFSKMLLTKKPSVSLRLLEQTGIMDIFIPEFKSCRNCTQADIRGYHEFDVADHLLYSADGAVCNAVPGALADATSDDDSTLLLLRLTAFFHDIGKPCSRTVEKYTDPKTNEIYDIIHFHGHEKKGAELTHRILTHLRYPNAIVDKVTHLVLEHMFYYESVWSDAAVRRFIVRIGKENLTALYSVRIADIYGMHNTPVVAGSPTMNNLLELDTRIFEVSKASTAFSLKDLAVDGKDLIAAGIPSGQILGAILKELLETVLDSPEMNERQKLLILAKNIYSQKYVSAN